ncbi:MAG TPA: SCP2 sterol-binding domain-containing protein [Ilumatobacter sp.]|jgi:putative sterol carrier protein|nr:SCP2 sterol-binding domain-containing protein [Ilumatobacter sp.]
MTDATRQFFEDLGVRGHEPLMSKFSGRVRFELRDGERTERWLLTIDRGDVSVSRGGGAAACTIRADKELFDRMAAGEQNTMTAALRGELVCIGDPDLLLAIGRLFPGPPNNSMNGARP